MEELKLCAGDASLGAKENESSDPAGPNDILGPVVLVKANLAGEPELLALSKEKQKSLTVRSSQYLKHFTLFVNETTRHI